MDTKTRNGLSNDSVEYTFSPDSVAYDLLFYGTACGHLFCNGEYVLNRSYHPGILVLYICEGTMLAEYEGIARTAEAGDVLLLDCTKPHYLRTEQKAEFYYLAFAGSNSKEIAGYIIRENGWWLRRKNNVRIRDLLKEKTELHQKNKTETGMEASLRIYRIIEVLMEAGVTLSALDLAISQSVQYIHDHLDEPLTLQRLADQANLSMYYYSHCFKDRMGTAPLDYVIRARIEKAKLLLARTDLSIDDVASAVGYTAARSLINRFRKYVGMTPARYRKEFGNS